MMVLEDLRRAVFAGADNIIVLNEGRVEEQGTHEALVQSGGLYARMWADYNQAIQWRISTDKEVR